MIQGALKGACCASDIGDLGLESLGWEIHQRGNGSPTPVFCQEILDLEEPGRLQSWSRESGLPEQLL